MADSPLSESLGELSRFFVGDSTVLEALTRMTELTQRAVPSAELVGITMLVEGRQRTAVFTDEDAPEIDQAQYASGDGPCLSAFEESRITEIEDTTVAGDWPEFRRAAADHGIRSTISFPLIVDKRSVGAMNLYSRRPHGFDQEASRVGEQFAAQAAVVLANTQAYWDAHELNQRLTDAMQHRAGIEQAKGILMAAQGVSEDDAFDMLVRASQRENVKLRDIARRIVDDAVSRARQSRGEAEGRDGDAG
jgi:GAF domain-containing protein